MNLQISLYQLQRFKELNIPAAITRKRDIYLSPAERTRLIRESGAKYCISNHINAGAGSGAETIHSIHTDDKLARTILDEISKEGINKRRVFCKEHPDLKGKDYYFIHRDTGEVEAIIIEYGFADNENDAKIIKVLWKKLAEATVRGFCLHIGLDYKSPEAIKEVPKWKMEGINWMYDKGLLTSDEWKEKIDDPVPLWAMGLTMKRLFKNREEEK